MTTTARDALDRARDVASRVVDPELPMLTLEDLGVLRSVLVDGPDEETPERVTVTITPTYSGCPALATMRDDLVHALHAEGFDDVAVRVALEPAWSTDDISERGRRALREHGLSPPGAAPAATTGPVPLTLQPTRRALTCPRCGSADCEVTSEFGPTPCTAVYRCRTCLEPFQHVKEI